MKKVIGYIRVSTNNQDLERQRTLIKRYCDDHGLLLVRLIEDYAISGAVSTRKGYLELQELTEVDADMIVVSELSRLSRSEDIMPTLTVIHNLFAKFDLVLLDDLSHIYKKGTTLDLLGFIGLAFKAYGAADERKKITERMQTGKDSLLLRFPMAVLDGNVPLGFKKMPHPDYSDKSKGIPKNIYVVDDEGIAIVRKIFSWADEGLSANKIAHKLVNIGFVSRRGKVVSSAYVLDVLHQPLYKGIRIHKGEEYLTGEEYVSADVWNRVQDTLKSNRTRSDKYTKHCNPLKNILKCACGCNMQLVMQAGGKSLQYACVSKRYENNVLDTFDPCSFYGINFNILNDILWHEVRYRILDKEYQAKSNAKIDSLKAENIQLTDMINKKHEEINQKLALQDQIIENIATSTNPRVVETLNKKVDAIDEEINSIKGTIDSITLEIAKNDKRIKEEFKSQTQAELENMTIEGKAEIFKAMFDTVVYASEKSRVGYIVVNYKNGIQTIYLYRYGNNHCKIVANLPSSFTYNPLTRKVAVKYVGSKENKFSLEERIEEYSPLEVIKTFYTEEWDITKEILG